MADAANAAARRSIRRHALAGFGLIVLLGGGVGGWAATAQISGALIASGAIVVDSNTKKVQHPSGGVVAEVRVRDGDRVRVGDLLVRLDETVTRANLAIVTKGVIELQTRRARLVAERDQADTVALPAALQAHADDADMIEALTSERKLFDLRRTARRGQKAQLRERIAQLDQESVGLAAQIKSKEQEIALISRELDSIRQLWDKKLVSLARLTQLEREATRLEGERGHLIAAVAQAKGRIAETELQIIQIDQDLSSEVAKELRDIDGRIGELVERKVTAEDQLRRIEIRAPQDGYIFQSSVHTVGGVISAGDAIMMIVPEADVLMAEAKVDPKDVDRVEIGQTAILRFVSFNQRTTPEINGTVRRLSADVSTDPRSGASYFIIRIAMSASEISRLGQVKLSPGMPVEAFIQTGDRTVMSYLMKPLADQFTRAMRER